MQRQRRAAIELGVSARSDPVALRLTPPALHPNLIVRSGIIERIAESRPRVVCIAAAPGYGKTSLAVQLTLQSSRPTVWLNADRAHDDPAVLLGDLLLGVRTIGPVDPADVESLAVGELSIRTMVARVLGVIAATDNAWLVIDDAHRIASTESLDALSALVGNVPPKCTVVLAGRSMPRLALARARAAGLVADIGPDDLAMDVRDASTVLRQHGVELSEDHLAALVTDTEGWPALIVLASQRAHRLSTKGGAGVLHVDTIVEYLREEVLAGRDEEEIRFLTRTSVLSMLNAPLCDAILDRTDSKSRLDALRRSSLLVDTYGGELRYHSLLRRFLRAELAEREPETGPALHLRAASWLASIGELERAVNHAFAAERPDEAARLIGPAILAYHWTGRRATLRQWLQRFDDDQLRRLPWLAVDAAWQALSVGDVAETERLAHLVNTSLYVGRPEDGTASFESGRAMLRSALARDGVDRMVSDATVAMTAEPRDSGWRPIALWLFGMASLAAGDTAAGDKALAEAARAARETGADALAHSMFGYRALLAVDRQDWPSAQLLLRKADAIPHRATAAVNGYLVSAPGIAARVRLAIHHGQISQGRTMLTAAVGMRPVMSAAAPYLAVASLTAMARAHLAAGDVQGARTALAQARQVIGLHADLGTAATDLAAVQHELATLPRTVATGASSLTTAELRVLVLLPYYLSFKEIGQRLGVKETTIKSHALSIYGKLGASSRSEAIDAATRVGLIEPIEPVSATAEDVRWTAG